MPCIECRGGVIICNSNPACPGQRNVVASLVTEPEQPTLIGEFSLVFYKVDEDARKVTVLGFESGTGKPIEASGTWMEGQKGWPGVLFTACDAIEVKDLTPVRNALEADAWNEVEKMPAAVAAVESTPMKKGQLTPEALATLN